MKLNKDINFRLSELDYEYLRQRAIKNDTSISRYLRKIIKKVIKEQLKNTGEVK